MGLAQTHDQPLVITSYHPSPFGALGDCKTEAWKQAERQRAQREILERATREWRNNRFKN